MPSHNSYQSNWNSYYQDENAQQDKYQNHDSSTGTHESGMDTRTYETNVYPKYTFPVEDNTQAYHYSAHPHHSYPVTSPDMQYMAHMINKIENQMDRLNHLIMQNNQLLQSLHDQEDTKCVQGNGGGSVIVRM